MSIEQSSVNKAMLLINKPWIDEEEKREIMNVLNENALTSAAKDGGKRVRDFESLLRDYLNIKHAVAVNSGTSALHVALLAAEIGQGDEVLLPSFTFVATANSVVATGAKPIFVDVNKYDYTIDLQDLKAKITKKSKAIIPVHLYGHPSDIDEIIELAEKYSINMIEDSCQSLGSTYKNKQTGTFGIMGCFSLYASKVLTSGEGGAVVTNNDSLAEKLKMIRNHGMVKGYDTRIFGLNLRLPELSAAIAKVQMSKLTKMLDLRKRNADILTNLISSFADDNEIQLPKESEKKKFNWYLYTAAFRRDNIRDRIQKKMLTDDKIGATVYYDPPVHKTPYYEKILTTKTTTSLLSSSHLSQSSNLNLANTEWASKHVLSLPVHPLLTKQDIERISDSIKNAF
jgi:dTDP-4-amino-4,6-dideoxygalactose transaminase